LKERGIKRWYTYPKTLKMNAHAERFNRTIQESFVDYHEDLLFTDLALFNRKLADWLVFYNASASAPHPRPALPAILPPATSTRVPKVLDSYTFLTRLIWQDYKAAASGRASGCFRMLRAVGLIGFLACSMESAERGHK
jgi:hypothetical protein